MKTPRDELILVLAKLSAKLPSGKFAKEVASYLLDENRTGELDSLARDLVEYQAEHGVVEVTAVSARKLNATALKDIRQTVKQLYPNARQVIIDQRLDETQIGGVRLEFPGRQLDLSLRGKLNKFKQLTVAE
jgi:F0F1-type ATP synthase delta subunit